MGTGAGGLEAGDAGVSLGAAVAVAVGAWVSVGTIREFVVVGIEVAVARMLKVLVGFT
jgi:hypothetical protein